MDAPIQSSLTQLEAALTRLTESISSYAPDLSAATSLLAADAALTDSLSALATHASNNILLAHLHSRAEFLAASYKAQIGVLADVRRQILAAGLRGPVSSSTGTNAVRSRIGIETGQGKGVDYKSVLAFARNLSRYSAPRGFKPPSVLRAEAQARLEAEAEEAAAIAGKEGSKQTLMVNGETGVGEQRTTIAVLVPSATTAEAQLQTAQASNGDTIMGNTEGQTQAESQAEPQAPDNDFDKEKDKEKDKNPGLVTLDRAIKAWLDPQLQIPFLPWPSEEMVARSGLARVGAWAGAVELPEDLYAASTLTTAAAAEVGAEHEMLQREDMQDERTEMQMHRPSHEQRPQPEVQKPKVFLGLDLYDPDEE